MKISKNQLKSMIMEELQSVLSEANYLSMPKNLPFLDRLRGPFGVGRPEEESVPELDQESSVEVPALGAATEVAEPKPLGTSSGTSLPTNYATLSLRGPGGDDQIAAGPRPPDITFKDSAGYTYAPDIARGGFYIKSPDGKTSYARAGSKAAESIASVQAGRGSLYGTEGYLGYKTPSSERSSFVRSQDAVGRAGMSPRARAGAAPLGYSPARRDIEEMIYEALLEEFGDK